MQRGQRNVASMIMSSRGSHNTRVHTPHTTHHTHHLDWLVSREGAVRGVGVRLEVKEAGEMGELG